MKPLNNYIQIEPEAHEDFIASMNATYDEIGRVIAVPDDGCPLPVGARVFFDSWMASKFPVGEGKYYWYVPYENIKAYEPLPKE